MPLTKRQKLLRREGIGGSDIAAIVGRSPFAGPHDVYLGKVPPYVEVEETDPMRAGTHLEAGIASWVTAEHGLRLARRDTFVHPRHPWARANLDRIVLEGRDRRPVSNLEIKNIVSERSASDWGAAGTDQIPDHVHLQVTWQMLVSGLRHSYVAAAFFGRTLRVYEVAYDEELGDLLLDAAADFWQRHIVPRVPPPPDSSESCRKSLALRFPIAGGAVVPASIDAIRWARQYAEASAAVADAQKRKNEAQAYLELEIGANRGIEAPSFKATWSAAQARVDWETAARAAGVTDEQAEQYRGEGGRRFRLTSKEGA